MIKIKNIKISNGTNLKILLRVPKNMFEYPTLKSKDLISHLSMPVIEEIKTKDIDDCYDSTLQKNKSNFKKIYVKAMVNYSIALYKEKNDNMKTIDYRNLSDVDLYTCEIGHLTIDDAEFCIRKDYPKLSIYDFSVDLSTDDIIISPVNESRDYYLYELNIIAKLELNPPVVINPDDNSTLLMLNSMLNKKDFTNEFTRGELSTINYLYSDNNPSFDFSIIKHLINLDKLTLYFSSFDYRNDEYDDLSKLSNLTCLHLAYNHLPYLPKKFGNLSKLTELYLYGNDLSLLPEDFSSLLNLATLYIYSNNLTSLPESFCDLTNLSVLYLDKNRLSSLPKNFRNLSNLSSLDLSENSLSSLDDEFCHLSNLIELFISNNKLSSLPNDFYKLLNLNLLDLSYNNFSSLPKVIGRLSSLISLTMTGNKISHLPKELNNLKQLKYLFLDENEFSTLPCEINKLENLELLDLDKNSISNLSALKNMKLRLSAKNQIIEFGTLTYNKNDNMYKLNLSFLRDNKDTMPQIINISNGGYLQSTAKESYMIWQIEEYGNKVHFDFDNDTKSDDFKFNGTVNLTLE